MWYDEAVFYQIYPLGFTGALYNNDGVCHHRLSKIEQWIPHMKRLGIDAVYFSPVFESDFHGYDTRDYTTIDCRLGTNEEFAVLVKRMHENGIRVVLDGVFNHVGRGFFAFKDVCEKKQDSRYKDWFLINFDGNSSYNDGFWYEGWEGYFNLVKLNLENTEVVDYLLTCVKGWVDEFDIDGIRLDVAYCLNHNYMKRLRQFTDQLKPQFFLLGEMLHGDYNTLVNDEMLHSATNYECYKGLYSSFNSMNMFEIAHSINRQFGSEQWCLYKGKHMFTFVDNHDVNRIASVLENKEHLPLIFGLSIGMPGIPCIYYGSEWGATGIKENGSDAGIRQCYDAPEFNELTEQIHAMITAYKNSKSLMYGAYYQKALTNRQYVFERSTQDEKIYVAINADGEEYTAYFDTGCCQAVEMISGNLVELNGSITLAPFSVGFYLCKTADIIQ